MKVIPVAALALLLCLPPHLSPAATPSDYTQVDAKGSVQGAYQPIVVAPVPAGGGDSWVVWVHYKGSALQLKGIAADGTQHEFNWLWDAPADFTWASLGRHTRAELGSKILLMHGADGSVTGTVDALIFASKDTFDPNTDLGGKKAVKPVDVPLPAADGKYTLIEAEADPKGQVLDDPNTSGGKYVRNDGGWQPMILTSLPAKGDSFVIWARTKGVPLQLKALGADGKQHDLNWSWDSPSDWKWVSFGSHTRDELGTGFLLMRGPDAKGTPGLDAVILTTDSAFDPGPAFPKLKNLPGDAPAPAPKSTASNTDPIQAHVTVDWTRTTGQTTANSFGSNDFSVIFPEASAQDPLYGKRIAEMGITLLRVHNGGLSGAWSDPATHTWDETKIKTAYDAPYLQGKTIIQNIPGWPGWMKDTDGVLDVSEYDHYAQFCADLVRILNKKQGRHIQYWEPLNEQDQHYAQKGKLDELWTLYNRCAIAMKAVDPTIKVGGIPFTWDDPAKVEPFLKACAPNIDFISWHRYGSGDKNDSTDQIMSYTPAYETQVKGFRALAEKYIPTRRTTLILDEFSIDYSWQSGETRQWSNVGAVWFASALKHMADGGLDMAASWNLKDGFYGIMTTGDELRPAGVVHQWGNRFLKGAISGTHSDQPMVEAMAIRQPDGSRSLLLINKAAGSATLTVQAGVKPSAATLAGTWLDATGTRTETMAPTVLSGQSPLVMPAYSLLLIRLPAH